MPVTIIRDGELVIPVKDPVYQNKLERYDTTDDGELTVADFKSRTQFVKTVATQLSEDAAQQAAIVKFMDFYHEAARFKEMVRLWDRYGKYDDRYEVTPLRLDFEPDDYQRLVLN